MANSTIEVYDKIRVKLGEDESRALLDYVDARIEKEAVTKLDLKETEDSIGSDMQEMENSLRSDMQEMKNSLRNDMQEMEDSLRNDMQKIAGNMQEMESSLRSDMQKMESSLRSEIRDIEWRSKLYFILLGALIIVTNPKVLELIGRVIGLIK